MNYIAVRGSGNPNDADGEYKQAIGLLYGIAFTIAVRGHYLPCSALRLIEGHIRKCISIYHILVDRYAFLVLAKLL